MEREKVKEIKKALECCAVHDCSDSCVFSDKHPFACLTEMHKQLLTLINELESENERLSKQLPQFAERVKIEFYAQFDELIPSIMADKIDQILNEFKKGKVQNYE